MVYEGGLLEAVWIVDLLFRYVYLALDEELMTVEDSDSDSWTVKGSDS